MPTVRGMNVSRVHGWGIYIFQNISLCWIYAANNFGSICKLNIYVGVGYSSLGIIVGAVGGRVGEYTFLKYILLDISSLQLGE